MNEDQDLTPQPPSPGRAPRWERGASAPDFRLPLSQARNEPAGRGGWGGRSRSEAGQSAIVAVIVLFLLLFLGAIFISIIANNLRSTQRAANVSQSGRYAEAGINYLDQQLTNSPDGADWRPVPDNSTNTQDPDYFWIQPYHYDNQRNAWVGGYTRVNFGSTSSGSFGPVGTGGGRALVRITYRPDPPLVPGTTIYQVGTVVDAQGSVVSSGVDKPTESPVNKYLKLESVGRSGQIDSKDPTTFGNSEGIGLRVEQVAYKAIGINEFVLQATNKDHKPVTAALGPASPAIDRGKRRDIENVIEGPVRFNSDVTFYGVNRFVLDPYRNDDIEVAGQIHLNGVSDSTTTLAAADPTRVYINTKPAANDIGNLFPSGSPDFTTSYADITNPTVTTPGIVRDNPRGSETLGINDADINNRNLRSVGRTDPPVIDAPTGPNGLTRYRALTQNSLPLSPNDTSANAAVNSANGLASSSGQYGWGQGMYLANTNNIQQESSSLVGGRSLRAEWLNADTTNPMPNWTGDLKYEPPAVTIILTPRYMILRRSAQDVSANGRGFNFRAPITSGSYNMGARIPDEEIIRYTYDANGPAAMQNVPTVGVPAGVEEFGAYPAYRPNNPASSEGVTTYTGSTSTHPNSYSSNFVIYAEGNIRIKGVVGGLDPETQQYFQRHLTVVSGGGNIYIDGNLLRDNIDPNDSTPGATEVRGRSSIALLAKQNVVVNTTQFLSPGDTSDLAQEQGVQTAPDTRVLSVNDPELTFHLSFGPEDSTNASPRYLTQTNFASGYPNPPKPMLFLRHGPAQSPASQTYIQIGLNESAAGAALANGATATNYNYIPFRYDPANPTTYDPTNTALASYADPADVAATTLLLQTSDYTPTSVATSLPALYDQTFVLPIQDIFGGGTQINPYSNPVSLVGTDNTLRIDYVTNHFSGPSTANYDNTRVGVAPLDIRVEALMYAQEGTFFIIPGPWFNPDPNDTYERFVAGEPNANAASATPAGRRAGENTANSTTALPRVSHVFPFYREPMDIRMTFFGAIAENLPAEVGDQSAWMEKWGWVPDYYGSTGLTGDPNFPTPPAAVPTVHGRYGYLHYAPDSSLGQNAPATGSGGSGIYYQYDPRAISPYAQVGVNTYTPLRPNPYFADQPLPLTPRLPVAPGLLYYGQSTELPQ